MPPPCPPRSGLQPSSSCTQTNSFPSHARLVRFCCSGWSTIFHGHLLAHLSRRRSALAGEPRRALSLSLEESRRRSLDTDLRLQVWHYRCRSRRRTDDMPPVPARLSPL